MTERVEGRRSTGATAPLRLLFVCTANISRSPYAERRARQALGGWNVDVASAGIPGYPGRGMDPEMAAQLVERGGDVTGHVSQAVSDALLAWSDLVLTFEFAQHMRLLDAHPEHAGKILGVGQLAAAEGRADAAQGAPPFDDVEDLVAWVTATVGVNSMRFDIDDPYRRGSKVATATADAIDRALDAFLPVLAEAELPRLAREQRDPPKRRRRWFR